MPIFARSALLAAVIALAAAAPAQAFQLQDSDAAPGAKQGYTDLDIRGFGLDKPTAKTDDNKNELRNGNFYMNFNQRSFNQQYDPSNMFNPFYRDGRQ